MGLQFLFMDDNAPCHRTVAAEQLLESEDIERMNWPARSPDLNHIEHVWDFLGRRLAARTLQPVTIRELRVAAVAEWYRYRTVACFVTGSSPVPLKTRRVGQRCTLNLSRAETSSRWCGVVVRRGGASSGVVHVT
ncbi:uncharacterized protein TNCV_2654431 [Trichonephila clavipes]|nr:uncharacterized protein TNCV_2654431 [Trichonephila clavipes]